jgi:hypothetical protein
MTPDPYTQLARHLHALGMCHPLKDALVDILRANFSPAEAEVALAMPNTRIPLELTTADEVAADLGRPIEEVADVLEELARRGLLFSGTTDDGQPAYALQQVGYGFPQSFFWKGGANDPRQRHGRAHRQVLSLTGNPRDLRDHTQGLPLHPCQRGRDTPLSEERGFCRLTIKGPFQAVYPYEVVEAVIRRARTIAVAHCPCRMTAHPCPNDAVRLKRRTDIAPPATFAELHGRILEEKK